jgi:muramoyltetrapeptide carboxypeptidase
VEQLNADSLAALKPPKLRAGDKVKFVSPASTPSREDVRRGAEILTAWGLRVELGRHVFDTNGHYLAGRDEDRLADVNDALRDPGIRAVFATAGGKGAYRIADGLDFDAARGDPKPLIGFSDITILHLARWHRCRLAGFHGPHVGWSDEYYGGVAAEHLRRALMEPAPITIYQDSRELTAKIVIDGAATGTLLGGNLDMIGTAVGWACPSFAGAILFIEDVDKHIGQIDRTLTQLLKSGCLNGVRGVAVGQFIRSAEEKPGKWSVVDVLQDRLAPLGVPVLGGLPIGHGPYPFTVPLGTVATLDTTTRTLTIEPGVCSPSITPE